MADLRARQLALARQAIVDACAELVTERRHLDFAMKDVAERAGVSLRTVYNHFPTREDLLDALGRRLRRRDGGDRAAPRRPTCTSRDDLLRAVRVNLGLFEELGRHQRGVRPDAAGRRRPRRRPPANGPS